MREGNDLAFNNRRAIINIHSTSTKCKTYWILTISLKPLNKTLGCNVRRSAKPQSPPFLAHDQRRGSQVGLLHPQLQHVEYGTIVLAGKNDLPLSGFGCDRAAGLPYGAGTSHGRSQPMIPSPIGLPPPLWPLGFIYTCMSFLSALEYILR